MRIIYLTSVFLHVMAAIVWIGGMVMFVVAVMPLLRKRDDAFRQAFLPEFGHRLRQVSWLCLAILVPTGAVNLWLRGVRPGDFLRSEWRSTEFGSLILAKVSLVVFAILFSIAHERVVARQHARWLGRSLLVVGVVIVAMAVALTRAM